MVQFKVAYHWRSRHIESIMFSRFFYLFSSLCLLNEWIKDATLVCVCDIINFPKCELNETRIETKNVRDTQSFILKVDSHKTKDRSERVAKLWRNQFKEPLCNLVESYVVFFLSFFHFLMFWIHQHFQPLNWIVLVKFN